MINLFKYLEELMEMIIIKIQLLLQEIQDQFINNQVEKINKNNI